MITSLTENQVFVFGSNLNGWHGGGAARQAAESFGAIDGQGIGIQGQSYAIPTLDHDMQKIPLEDIELYLFLFLNYAKRNPDKEFLLTPIGTGIAGYSLQDIKDRLPPFTPNVKLVGDWEKNG